MKADKNEGNGAQSTAERRFLFFIRVRVPSERMVHLFIIFQFGVFVEADIQARFGVLRQR